MAKAKSKPLYIQEPTPKTFRVGCKVSWNYYETEAEALIAAKAAIHNAAVQESRGYDFGYQSPGSVKQMKPDLKGEWAEFSGLWEVCMP